MRARNKSQLFSLTNSNEEKKTESPLPFSNLIKYYNYSICETNNLDFHNKMYFAFSNGSYLYIFKVKPCDNPKTTDIVAAGPLLSSLSEEEKRILSIDLLTPI